MQIDSRVQIHEPELIVPDECVEKGCRGLSKVVGEALMSAFRFPDFQEAVVCERARKLGCNAMVISTGQYAGFGRPVENSDEKFVPNPTIYGEPGQNGVTADEIVERARAVGSTNHTLSELAK